MSEEYDDSIEEDPDEAVEDDEMNPGEAGFARGEAKASQGDEDKEEKEEEED